MPKNPNFMNELNDYIHKEFKDEKSGEIDFKEIGEKISDNPENEEFKGIEFDFEKLMEDEEELKIHEYFSDFEENTIKEDDDKESDLDIDNDEKDGEEKTGEEEKAEEKDEEEDGKEDTKAEGEEEKEEFDLEEWKRKQEEEEREDRLLMGVDEDDLLDPYEESLKTSSNDVISFDDLNEGSETENENEILSSNPQGKKSFESLNQKKKFEAGKFNKNTAMIAVLIFGLIVVAGLWWAGRDKTKKSKDEISEDDYLAIDGYTPDFGNYKERAYKENEEETGEESIEKINKILKEGEKEEFKAEKPQNENLSSYRYAENTNPAPQTVSNDSYNERVKSSIRKNINGKNGEDISYLPYTASNASYNPIPSQAGTEGYIDGINQIRNSLSNQGTNVQSSSSLRFTDAGRYDPSKTGGDISYIPENSLYPGTSIPALLISGINTDYPGMITARVMSNVYDSKTGTKLLIPSGSILRATYSSSSIGISRVQIAWTTLVINRDGVDFIVNLGSQVGTDAQGYSGIKGSLNEHAFAYLKAAGISSLFTYINSNIYAVTAAQKNRTYQQMISDSQEIENRLAERILDRALDIQPTVTVKNGTKVYVDVSSVITLVPFDRDIPKQKYVRK